jgi:hypothetical protein
MSDAPKSVSTATQEGPQLETTTYEVQGVFPSDAALQKAIGELTLEGFDRADFSLPNPTPAPGDATPDQSAENPTTDVDVRQVRTMGASMGGFAGAAAAAGVTLATGGTAALAVGAAAAIGLGAGALAEAGGQTVDAIQSSNRDEKAKQGALILAVRITDNGKSDIVQKIMHDAGATRVVPVTRADQAVTGGMDASGWTG